MIPVFMRDQQVVDFRHVLSRIDVGSGKGFVEERERCGMIAEDRVEQHSLAAELNVIGGMAEPDDHVRRRVKAFKVCFHRRHRPFGDQSFGMVPQVVNQN